MIPQRVKLSGFLSYREEQEVRFDGSQLWMLSGTNGSGKSSIFDAVTFALFGHHRGGSQSAGDLINKESGNLSVEFDFTVEKQLYRIKRTVRRQKSDKIASTQQAMRKIDANGDWEPIPDTNYKARFDAWVRDQIGLDYETFTSSVLLLQGRSEKLLDSTPAGRAGVLARIVDLERYQKLHARADDKRKELKGRLEGIAHRLAAIREVTDEELSAARSQVATAEEARAAVERRIDGLLALEAAAREWDRATKRHTAAREKLALAQGVLATAAAIEKEYARFRELRDVLPAVGVIVTERGRIHESERSTERLIREQSARGDERRRTEHAVEEARLKLTNLKRTLGEDEAKQKALGERLRDLTGILEKARQVEEAEAEVKRLEAELKSLPADPETPVGELEREQERLVVLEQHIAVLERLQADRCELIRVAAAEQTARQEEARLLAEGKTAKEEFGALELKAGTAREDRAHKDCAAAEAQALARRARELADEFESLSGEKTCRACGQPLTSKHFAEEKKARSLAAKEADAKLKSLADAAARARKLEEELTAKESAERDHLAKLRDHYRDAALAVKQAGLDARRLTDSCRKSYFALPDEFKEKISPAEPDDWPKVEYPDRHALAELAARVHGLDAVRRKLTVARDAARKVGELRAKLESAGDRLSRTSAALRAGDPAEIREEFTAKQAEETAVAANITAAKKAILAAEADVERLQGDLNAADRDLIELAGRLHTEEVSRKQSADAVERARKSLPDGWRDTVEAAGLAERGRWQDELDDLAGRDVEKRHADLHAARAGLDALRAEIGELDREVAAFPPEAQRAPENIRAEVEAARGEIDSRHTDLLEAQRAQGILDDYRRQRGELSEECKAVDVEFNRYKLLAELLGRDRLQRHLVRTAEKQIVDHANAVLDRLSGGQLFLKLVGGGEDSTEKALELECSNRVTGGAAINVAFLSGSQRFRVAVALALGIGQYAGKQHRPIESVIIDEGFGCLDRNGRQVMIQELQNLRGHLECILLVSHQEEFAEAFPDGYHFELQNGATRVTRFAR